MTIPIPPTTDSGSLLKRLTERWGSHDDVSLYLDRCQVDTPCTIVEKIWAIVRTLRPQTLEKVVDFGAGDGRFANPAHYHQYLGFEIDPERTTSARLPANAALRTQCAFAQHIDDADLCIGNPPYVRNQDLPNGWRQHASDLLCKRTGVKLSGLANAWQYFFLLSLASTKSNGLVALVVPYEWVSRPSSGKLRHYIVENKWSVSAYRLRDETFQRVLTTSSIAIIDKSASTGVWKYYQEDGAGRFLELPSPTVSPKGVLRYVKRTLLEQNAGYAKRGLSPGTQQYLVLSEGERVHAGLKVGSDVVPCVTSLRHLPPDVDRLSQVVFDTYFRAAGHKCWLIRTDNSPSDRLLSYLSAAPPQVCRTVTCQRRSTWWRFSMPDIPNALVATGFREARPKMVINYIGARAVGAVSGIHGLSKETTPLVVSSFRHLNLSNEIVAHSNGLKKLESNQINNILGSILQSIGPNRVIQS